MRQLALVLLATLGGIAALAADKGGPMRLRVVEEGGATTEGRGQIKKDQLEIETPTGPKKIPVRRIQSIEELDVDAPPPEVERPRDRSTFEERAAALDKKTDEPRALAHQWTSLGEWAHKRGLEAERKQAFEKAVAIYADDADAERWLGRAKDDDGSWKDAREVFEKKRKATAAETGPLMELARWAFKNGLDEEAEKTIDPLNAKNAFDKALLSFLRPLTDRHKQATEIGMPLRGRWKASQDPSHHHELKTYAVYAIDFYKEVDGKTFKGDGKNVEDHFAWGQPVYAVADGTVVGVTDGIPDNPIGKIPPGDIQYKNNNVCVVHSGGEMSWNIHLQKGSIKVKLFDKVKKGDLLGLVGNSGASTWPHLHFTLVDAHKLSIPWKVDDFDWITEEGVRVKVKRSRVLEGMLVETKEN
ncbi:MAG TPA: M23 family metallopeptidase [Planctomycetota bacterium]|nr:M23 family metallopeptidase [Planctomycetota bacterium]